MNKKMRIRYLFDEDVNIVRIDNNILQIIYNPYITNRPNIGFKGIGLILKQYEVFLDENYIDCGMKKGTEWHMLLEARRKK